MFLPVTKKEMDDLGWTQPDVILVSGDTYIDSPHMGIAVIGHTLMNAGYKVAIIAQPDISNDRDIARLGEPRLFWGVSAGSVDSMVANYTASKKPRNQDDYTPGESNNRRPDRACMVYTNLIRRNFKNTCPIVLGGMEASLRRLAHYDFWTDKIRGSILLDAKADYLLYGMAEKSVLDLAFRLSKNLSLDPVRGLVYQSRIKPVGAEETPSLQDVKADKKAFIRFFSIFYDNCDPVSGKQICQKHDERYVILNPPQEILSQTQLDDIYNLPFERDVHPFYKKMGKVRALETIRFSVTTHRGCYGECNFCAIAIHEGRIVQWRSEKSILHEIETIANLPDFKGVITDMGGPTANMYGFECSKKIKQGACKNNKRCLYPEPCPSLAINHQRLTHLMQQARRIPKVNKIVAASGIRYDMLLADQGEGERYLEEVCNYHISGQLKIAPEHHNPTVLALMGKPGRKSLLDFKEKFDRINKNRTPKQFLTYYFIAAHPGCTIDDMRYLKRFVSEQLKINPEQTQIFTPTPSTWSTLMYATEINPFTMEPIFVEKDANQRQKQKDILIEKREERKR